MTDNAEEPQQSSQAASEAACSAFCQILYIFPKLVMDQNFLLLRDRLI